MKRKSRFPIRIILVNISSLAAIFILFFLCYRFLTTSEYFKISDSDYFLGQNIFKINLRKEAQGLKKAYPDYKSVTLRRRLPEGIIIDFKLRQAVARVKLSEYFYVDKEGTLFLSAPKEESNSKLPLIFGLEMRIPHPKSGVKYNENSLQAILEFINNLKKAQDLDAKFKIKEINLANANDVFLFTAGGGKINLGGIGSLNKALSILQRLNDEIDLDFDKIEYIDLRFREPVVKYK